jgi:hypothetical protein
LALFNAVALIDEQFDDSAGHNILSDGRQFEIHLMLLNNINN